MSNLKNKPEDTAFKQQRIPSYQPIYTPKAVSIIFFILSLVLYAFGFPIYVISTQIIEVTQQYDTCTLTSSNQCILTLNIDQDIPQPVYVYYKLTNFYQNHRLYVRSRSYTQLRNGNPLSTELAFCAPAEYNSNFAGYYNATAKPLNPNDIAIPCGMVARSVFNDSYSFSGYQVNTDNIIFPVDQDIWKNGDESKQWLVMDNHLRVWMKISPFSTFRKLWGVIETDVKKGSLQVTIDSNYPVHAWDGTKSLVLSNANAFGGRNPALGIILIVSGSFAMMCALIFLVTAIVYRPPDYGDPLSWKY